MTKKENNIYYNNKVEKKYEQILTFYVNGEFKVFKALEITNDLTKEELEKIKEDFNSVKPH